MKKSSQDLIVVLGAICFGLSQVSIAADNVTPVTATATINWSQLKFSVSSVTDTNPTIVFSNYHTSVDATNSIPEGSESNSGTRNNWTSILQTDAGDGISVAAGLASSTMFSGMADAVGAGSTASSSGNRSVDFSIDGPGILTVMVPYTVTLTGAGLDWWNIDSASVSGNASFYNYMTGSNASSNSSASFSLNSYEGLTSQAGNLVFGIVASDAGTGSLSVGFNLNTHGVGVVPELESYAMLLAGLGIMGAVIRRRNKNNSKIDIHP